MQQYDLSSRCASLIFFSLFVLPSLVNVDNVSSRFEFFSLRFTLKPMLSLESVPLGATFYSLSTSMDFDTDHLAKKQVSTPGTFFTSVQHKRETSTTCFDSLWDLCLISKQLC